jgi:Kef-type K+ transport system membrane component KefB
MFGFKMSGSVAIAVGIAMIAVTAMALVVVGYLLDIYSEANLIVAALATLIVAAAIFIPYKAAQRMCARKHQRPAVVRPD